MLSRGILEGLASILEIQPEEVRPRRRPKRRPAPTPTLAETFARDCENIQRDFQRVLAGYQDRLPSR